VATGTRSGDRSRELKSKYLSDRKLFRKTVAERNETFIVCPVQFSLSSVDFGIF
jgi:hypothetical protein